MADVLGSASSELIPYSSDSFVIANKPHGIPTVPLKGQSTDGTLLGLVAELFPDVLSVKGRNSWECGAVHRLDTATGGLVVFARTQGMYDHLLSVQTSGRFLKTYRALTCNDGRLKGQDPVFDAEGRMEIASYFRSYGPGSKQVRPTSDIKRADSPVLYTTLVRSLGDGAFECTITRGFRHQIRAHLAWIGSPIIGDPLYGSAAEGEILKLDCIKLSFPMPDVLCAAPFT